MYVFVSQFSKQAAHNRVSLSLLSCSIDMLVQDEKLIKQKQQIYNNSRIQDFYRKWGYG